MTQLTLHLFITGHSVSFLFKYILLLNIVKIQYLLTRTNLMVDGCLLTTESYSPGTEIPHVPGIVSESTLVHPE